MIKKYNSQLRKFIKNCAIKEKHFEYANQASI